MTELHFITSVKQFRKTFSDRAYLLFYSNLFSKIQLWPFVKKCLQKYLLNTFCTREKDDKSSNKTLIPMP